MALPGMFPTLWTQRCSADLDRSRRYCSEPDSLPAGIGGCLILKPPLRAAINEALIGFIFISGANAFIVYPLLDMVSNMNGDWRQMYDSGVPWLTAIIVAIQIAVLVGGYWLFTNEE